MNGIRELLARVSGRLRAGRLDRDLDREIAAHLDEAAEEYVQRGLSPTDARRAAARDFGRVVTVREAWREARSFLVLDSAVRDLQHALRVLRRSLGFAATVVTILAVAMAAVTTVFTLLNAVVLRPLPYARAEQLVTIGHTAPGLGAARTGVSSALYHAYADRAQSLSSIAAYRERVVLNLRVADSGAEPVQVTYASAAMFRLLNVRPERGRLFTEEDGRPGFMNVTWQIPVLLSHRFWTERFGGDPAALGRIITLNGTAREIVGVLPAAFTFPRADTQIWMLLEPPPTSPVQAAGSLTWDVIARVRGGADSNAVEADLTRILKDLEAGAPNLAKARLAPIVTPLKTAQIGDSGRILWLLFGGMLLMLLVAGANVAGLFLVRTEHRAHEIAVRRALGAGGAHLARLFFLEALALCAAAGAIGLVLSKALVPAILTLSPFELPRTNEIALGAPSVAFTMIAAVLLAIFCAALSLRQKASSLQDSLAAGDARSTGRGRHFSASNALIVAQVTVAFMLMSGSALLVQTYRNLSQAHLGFSPGSLTTVEIGLPGRKARQHVQIYNALVDRVRQMPGVQRAALASFVPLTPSEDLLPVDAGTPPVAYKFFVPGYLQAMGTATVEGTAFAPGERVAAARPVIVSAALARRLYPGQRAVGKTIERLTAEGRPLEMGRGAIPPFTIAGVADDTRETSPRDGPTEIVYVPLLDPPVEVSIVPTNVRLVIRSDMPAAAFAPLVRAAIASIDPDVSVGAVEPMAAIVARARAREAFLGVLLVTAAALSLLLGGVGIYGAVAQMVRRRTREIGIRLALGAERGAMVRLVTAGSARLVLIGSALGLAAALPAARLLQSLLFGVDGRDPLTWIVVVAIVVVSSTCAALAAGRRAAHVTPLVALRGE